MRTELHWVDGPWPGKLAIGSRPRGGDWLADEVADWHRAGIEEVALLPMKKRVLILRKSQQRWRVRV